MSCRHHSILQQKKKENIQLCIYDIYMSYVLIQNKCAENYYFFLNNDILRLKLDIINIMLNNCKYSPKQVAVQLNCYHLVLCLNTWHSRYVALNWRL